MSARNLVPDALCALLTVRATTGHPVFIIAGQDLGSRPWPEQLNPKLEAKSLETGRWVNSNDVLVGDVMIGVDAEKHVISEIAIEHVVDEPVYHLNVHGNHTFAVGENGLLVHNESWCELAWLGFSNTTKQGHKDLNALRQKVADAWGKNALGATHGHHIVHKVGAASLSDAGKVFNQKSAALLDGFGIDTVVDKAAARKLIKNGDELHNLCIAPYNYVHSDAYVKRVNEMLLADLRGKGLTNLLVEDKITKVWTIRGDLKPDQLAKGKKSVTDVLGEIRNRIHNGKTL